MDIVLIDDHLLFTQSLKNLLFQHGYHFVTIYESIDSFSSKNGIKIPDVIIMDLSIPGTNGMQFLETYGKKIESKIIVLSVQSDVQTIKQALRNGANGFISKSSTIEELVEAIQQVNKGNQYIEKSLRENLLDNMFTEESIIYHLSPREKDVLNKICSGNTIKEIAYELNLSPHTVQYYYRNVMNKLKLKRSAELIVFAIKHGLYSPKID